MLLEKSLDGNDRFDVETVVSPSEFSRDPAEMDSVRECECGRISAELMLGLSIKPSLRQATVVERADLDESPSSSSSVRELHSLEGGIGSAAACICQANFFSRSVLCHSRHSSPWSCS